MSAYPRTDQIYPPTFFRRFTSLGTALVLHADASNGGSAPTDVNYLPCLLIVEATATDVLQVTDVTGTVSAITFDATGTFELRLAPVSIGGASTNVNAVTVCWTQAT